MKQEPTGYSWQENNHQQRKTSTLNINQNGYTKPCNSKLNNVCRTQVR